MALFRSTKPIVFDPYGSRRSRPLMPRWLVILLLGVALGAGGLYYLQQNHLPPRLTPAESQRLLARLTELDGERLSLKAELESERKRLQGALDGATGEAKSALAENRKLGEALAVARQSVDRLQTEIGLFDQVLPADPRGGAVGVRAARFGVEGGQLVYHVLLTRDQKGEHKDNQKASQPFKGVMELAVAGQRAGGRSDTVSLEPVAVLLDRFQNLVGKLPLPEGFDPRQTTIRILDNPGGKQFGMRVINVR